MAIISRLHDIEELPTLPEVLLKVQSLTDSDDADASVLSTIIEEDPSLSAKILRIANSTIYRRTDKRISSVARAVTRLGFNEVRDIAVSTSLIRRFSSRSTLVGHRDFWRHSITAGYLAEKIAESAVGSPDRQSMFLAGLLHDVGILIFDQFFHDKMEQIRNNAVLSEVSYLTAEADILGTENHAAVGGALLEIWGLDPSVFAAVRYHHEPWKCPMNTRSAASVVAVTEYLICSGKIGSLEGAMDLPPREIWDLVGMGPAEAEKLFEHGEMVGDRADAVLASDAYGTDRPLPRI